MIRATSLLVALLVPISADARLGIPDALGVLRAAMIPFELPEPFFLVPRDLPLPPVIRVKSLRLCPASTPRFDIMPAGTRRNATLLRRYTSEENC